VLAHVPHLADASVTHHVRACNVWCQSEIDSRPLVVERKRLYFNVRQNSRGRFLKIAEVNRQRRSTVIIPQRCVV